MTTVPPDPSGPPATSAWLLETVKAIVTQPGQAKIDFDPSTREIRLTVARDDVGRILGRSGRTVAALRRLLDALGTRSNARYRLLLFDHDGREIGQRQTHETRVQPTC